MNAKTLILARRYEQSHPRAPYVRPGIHRKITIRNTNLQVPIKRLEAQSSEVLLVYPVQKTTIQSSPDSNSALTPVLNPLGGWPAEHDTTNTQPCCIQSRRLGTTTSPNAFPFIPLMSPSVLHGQKQAHRAISHGTDTYTQHRNSSQPARQIAAPRSLALPPRC